jgi:TatD family-associated radical SAM protein
MDKYVYIYQNKLYLNITNRCSNRCKFCIRKGRQGVGKNDLWLKKEPDFNDMVKALEGYDLKKYNEVTFCGFGEPVYNLETLLKTAEFLKSKGCIVRLNTNGQGNLIHGRNIVPELSKVIDVISISLNSSDGVKYQNICLSRFENAYQAILDFAKECLKSIPVVIMTKVDEGDEAENKACEKVCKDLGAVFRLRQKV